MHASRLNADRRALSHAEPAAPALTDRRERTRQAILAGAFGLIGHANGLSVRIEEICAKVGISRGSFYNYFSNMPDLLAALSYNLTHGFMTAVRAEMAAMKSAAEQCDAGQRYFLHRARDDTAWGWAMVNIGAMGPLFGAETSASAEQTIADGIRAGEFVIADASVGRDLVLGTAHAAILTHLRQGSAPDMPQVASRAVLTGLGVAQKTIDRIVGRHLPPL